MQSLNLDTYIPAANGQCISALLVFAHALSFFRRQSLDELEDLLGHEVPPGQIRWVITVPAIWRQHAKQFMRQAAYKVSLRRIGGCPFMCFFFCPCNRNSTTNW